MSAEALARFDAGLLELLRDELEVDIETWNPLRGSRRVTIWIVVVGDAAYVRSFRGPGGRWYQDLRVEPHGAVHLRGRRIPVRAELADDPYSVEAVSRALASKYRGDPATPAMLTPYVLGTTLRLEPA